MDIRKLSIFEAVARLRSFSRAAEALHMAQPAVSIAVRKLEENCGGALLTRDRKGIDLTAKGEALYQRAVKLLADMEALEAFIASTDKRLEGRLSLSSPAMLASYCLPALIAEFIRQHPGISTTVQQEGTRKIREMLLADDIELGFISADDQDIGLDYVPLIRQNIVLFVSSENPLAQASELGFDALDTLPIIAYEKSYFLRQLFDKACLEAGVSPAIHAETNFLPLMLEMVRNTEAVGIGLEMMTRAEKGIRAIPLLPAKRMELGCAVRAGRRLSEPNRLFFDWLQKYHRL